MIEVINERSAKNHQNVLDLLKREQDVLAGRFDYVSNGMAKNLDQYKEEFKSM